MLRVLCKKVCIKPLYRFIKMHKMKKVVDIYEKSGMITKGRFIVIEQNKTRV